jgi:hypothetical protein
VVPADEQPPVARVAARDHLAHRAAFGGGYSFVGGVGSARAITREAVRERTRGHRRNSADRAFARVRSGRAARWESPLRGSFAREARLPRLFTPDTRGHTTRGRRDDRSRHQSRRSPRTHAPARPRLGLHLSAARPLEDTAARPFTAPSHWGPALPPQRSRSAGRSKTRPR